MKLARAEPSFSTHPEDDRLEFIHGRVDGHTSHAYDYARFNFHVAGAMMAD